MARGVRRRLLIFHHQEGQIMKRILIGLLIVTLALPACTARHAAARVVAQTPATRPAAQESPSPDLWRRVAEKIQPGTTVTVDMIDGGRFKGIFLAADASVMSVRPRTRVPEAVQQIPFERIAHVDVEPSGVTLAEAAAVGTGAGLGAFLGLMLLLTIWDD
jgi:hypothetical protein